MGRKPGSRLKPRPESFLLGLMAFMMVVLLLMVLVLAEQANAAKSRPWCFSQAPDDASSMYSGNHSLGWHFYCDREEETAEPESGEKSATGPEPEKPMPSEDEAGTEAMEKIRELRRQLEQKRAAAILEPTTENVAAYLHLQQETLERAAVFSDVFRRTVWSTPELDYTLRRPVGALAKRLWSDGRRAERDDVLSRLGERYGLIYLGDADCEGCRVFGPLLRAFSMRHGLDVLAVSLDGKPLEGWPEAVPDDGRAERLGLGGAPLPAVVLFDTRTNKVQPVGFGVLAEDQLAERIFLSVSREVGSDF